MSLERLGLILVAIAAFGMASMTWKKWADPVIDFGTELYVPWRIYEGDVIFRDVTHTYAPLSAYVNVLWFTLFGLSYRSLVIGNAIIFSGILVLLHLVIRKSANSIAASAALVFVVLVFAFGQYVDIGNYNYLSPYAHEVTHGLLASFLALAALFSYFETGRRRVLAGCGLALGFAFLTKYEIFFAALGAVLVGLFVFRMRTLRQLGIDLLTVLSTLALPFLACWAFLATKLPTDRALRGALGAYPLLFNRELLSNSFFADSAGLSFLGTFAYGFALWSGVYAMTTFPAAFLGRSDDRLDPRLYGLAAGALPVVVILAVGSSLPWVLALVPLPVVLGFLVAAAAKRVRQEGPNVTALMTLTLGVFSLLLLSRIPFFARVHNFGFALAMPGTAIVVTAALSSVPKWISKRGLNGGVFRAAVIGLLAAFSVEHVAMTARLQARQTYSFGEGPDEMKANERGRVMQIATEILKKRVTPSQSVTVMPEGAILNFMARRRSSVRFVTYTPFSISEHTEAAMVQELQASPPDFVVVLSREMRSLQEFGCQVFGEDCARDIGTLLKEGYAAKVIVVWDGRRLVTLLARRVPGAPDAPPEVVEATFNS